MSDRIARIEPLDGRRFANEGISLQSAPVALRLSVRASQKGRAAAGKAVGIALPNKPKTSATGDGRHALWLGPDEWLLIDEATSGPEPANVKSGKEWCCTDVSHRNTAVIVSGPAAESVMNGGCPQDLSLSAFPVGACSRTVYGKAEIVLLRTSEDSFRVECWRSFAPYVWTYLVEAAKDAVV